MGCLMKVLGCLTCGFGPRFLAWLKQNIGWYSWRLRAQIMFAFFFVLGHAVLGREPGEVLCADNLKALAREARHHRERRVNGVETARSTVPIN